MKIYVREKNSNVTYESESEEDEMKYFKSLKINFDTLDIDLDCNTDSENKVINTKNKRRVKKPVYNKIEFTYDKKRKCWLNKINNKFSNVLVHCKEYTGDHSRRLSANWDSLEKINQTDVDTNFYSYIYFTVNLKYFDDGVLEINEMHDGDNAWICVNFNYENYLNIYHNDVYNEVQEIVNKNVIDTEYYG